MNLKPLLIPALSATISGGAALYEVCFMQQGVPAAGGQPSRAPSPGNSQPRPSNPGTPSGQPGVTPGPTTTPGPSNPGAANPSAGNPNNPNNPGAQPNARLRYERPFAFSSPAMEARFTESTRRLVSMEQRLNRQNQDLMKRLGEARSLPADRQSAAYSDILQQILKDQALMNQYLVASRTAWTGDLEGSVAIPEEGLDNTQPGTPQPQPVPVPENSQPASGTPSAQPGASNPQPAPSNPPR